MGKVVDASNGCVQFLACLAAFLELRTPAPAALARFSRTRPQSFVQTRGVATALSYWPIERRLVLRGDAHFIERLLARADSHPSRQVPPRPGHSRLAF